MSGDALVTESAHVIRVEYCQQQEVEARKLAALPSMIEHKDRLLLSADRWKRLGEIFRELEATPRKSRDAIDATISGIFPLSDLETQ